MDDSELEMLKGDYGSLRPDIEARLDEFRAVWECGSDDSIFRELVFCLLTPQSKARSCWAAVERLHECNLLNEGSAERITAELKGVRFHHTKARRVVDARRFLPGIKSRLAAFGSSIDAREWLVKNVNGMSYKEASHFLRNIGKGRDLAILDRHILKNLLRFNVIENIVMSITPRRYLEIEENMRVFCRDIKIPMDHLDMLLWCRETGEIFK